MIFVLNSTSSPGSNPPIVLLASLWAPLVAQLIKNLPAMQETPVHFLGQEIPLEKGLATHFSIVGLPWWLRW